MTHDDHVRLLRPAITRPGGVWADLGSGTGAFTLALAELLGPEGEIYSVDRDPAALREQTLAFRRRVPAFAVRYVIADFTRPLELPPLTGIVMANSLHFIRDKDAILARVRRYLQPGGRLVLVEYDADVGNAWVPYPIGYASWRLLADKAGFANVELVGRTPSRFLGSIYCAASDVPS